MEKTLIFEILRSPDYKKQDGRQLSEKTFDVKMIKYVKTEKKEAAFPNSHFIFIF